MATTGLASHLPLRRERKRITSAAATATTTRVIIIPSEPDYLHIPPKVAAAAEAEAGAGAAPPSFPLGCDVSSVLFLSLGFFFFFYLNLRQQLSSLLVTPYLPFHHRLYVLWSSICTMRSLLSGKTQEHMHTLDELWLSLLLCVPDEDLTPTLSHRLAHPFLFSPSIP